MGVDNPLGENIITTSLDALVNWSRKSSIWPMTFGLAEMGTFIVILFVGYIYVWKKGALEWE